MYLVYSLAFTLGVILAAPYYLWRLGRNVTSVRWGERFGFLPPTIQQAERGAFWVHAVSVGETLAVVPLVREFQQSFPERKVFLSHITPAGLAAGEGRLPAVAGRFYAPLDWRCSARRALRRIQPAILLVVETELWPHLLRAARQAGARVVLVNARISDQSFRRYRLFRFFMRHVLSGIDRICAQTSLDAERFRGLGARPDAVVVTGNLKFDAQPPQLGEFTHLLGQTLQKTQRGPVMVAASTMPGEEALVLQAWDAIRARHPRGLLILAPRHPARFDQVAESLTAQRRSFLRRTALATSGLDWEPRVGPSEILLLDTVGELAGIFELADVVFMGGSLVPTGGHNILEPAYWGKAILFGPHMHNFRDIAGLFLQEKAAVQVQSAQELSRRILELMDDEVARRQLGEKARQIVEQQSGATRRVLEHIRELLKTETPLHPRG